MSVNRSRDFSDEALPRRHARKSGPLGMLCVGSLIGILTASAAYGTWIWSNLDQRPAWLEHIPAEDSLSSRTTEPRDSLDSLEYDRRSDEEPAAVAHFSEEVLDDAVQEKQLADEDQRMQVRDELASFLVEQPSTNPAVKQKENDIPTPTALALEVEAKPDSFKSNKQNVVLDLRLVRKQRWANRQVVDPRSLRSSVRRSAVARRTLAKRRPPLNAHRIRVQEYPSLSDTTR